jgi:hypothetical protein
MGVKSPPEVSLPERPSWAARTIVAWLAYPEPRTAERAVEWLRSWSALNIIKAGGTPKEPPTLKPNRLERNLASLDHRLRLRLAIGEQWHFRLIAAHRLLPPWRDAVSADPRVQAHVEALQNARQLFREGGKLPPLSFQISKGVTLNLVMNVPPLGTRALARWMAERGIEREVSNEIRRLVAPSRPVLHLAAACSQILSPILVRDGLAQAAFCGDWVSNALRQAEKHRQVIAECGALGVNAEDLIQFRQGHPRDSF